MILIIGLLAAAAAAYFYINNSVDVASDSEVLANENIPSQTNTSKKTSRKTSEKEASRTQVNNEKPDIPSTQANDNSKCICPPPDWMPIAVGEMNKKIQRYGQQGKKGNHPTIMKYHKTTNLEAYSEKTSWCGSFVNWVMLKAGHNTGKVENAAWARDWKHFGKEVKKPIYGAIGVKRRGKGGHVSFVVGVDNIKNPKYVYMLGGNQFGLLKKSAKNDISWGTKTKSKRYIKSVLYPSRYRITAWDLGFYVPKKYYKKYIKAKKCCKLKKYTGKFIISKKDGT